MPNGTLVTGLNTDTIKHLIVDSGAIYLNYGEADEKIMGATNGGNEFAVNREIKPVEIDGTKGKTKGLQRLVSEDATLKVNIKEITYENIKVALSGSSVDSSTSPDYHIITSKGEISDSDYLTNVALVGRVSGSSKPVIIILKNAISLDSFNWTTGDKDEVTIPITFSATYDLANPTDVPYEIRYPQDA